jgi:hypothetical protein
MRKSLDGTSNAVLGRVQLDGLQNLSDAWMKNGVGVKRLVGSEGVFRSAFVFTGMAGQCCEWGGFYEVDDGTVKAPWQWFKAGPHSYMPEYINAWGLNSEWPSTGSIHPSAEGIVNGDGSVHFIGTTITYQVWCAINGIRDGLVVDAGF